MYFDPEREITVLKISIRHVHWKENSPPNKLNKVFSSESLVGYPDRLKTDDLRRSQRPKRLQQQEQT